MSRLYLNRPSSLRHMAGRRLRLLSCLLGSALVLMGVSAVAADASASALRFDARSPGAVLAASAEGTSLESAATKAGETGRNVAMSLIGLALAVAAIVLAFKRDFREAAAVFAVGIVCVLLATPAGESLLRDTVKALVG
jgi:hypothetical protein